MMEAVRTSETSVDNNFTRQYIPEDNSEQNETLIHDIRISIQDWTLAPPKYRPKMLSAQQRVLKGGRFANKLASLPE
jgi:hypothetical protein